MAFEERYKKAYIRGNITRLESEDRYKRDPLYARLVDTFQVLLEDTPDITPTELREAVMFAAMLVEMRTCRNLMIPYPPDARFVRSADLDESSTLRSVPREDATPPAKNPDSSSSF